MELFDQPQNNQCVTIIVFRALIILRKKSPVNRMNMLLWNHKLWTWVGVIR